MVVYPTLVGLTFPMVRKPVFSTIVSQAASGLEVRVGNYIYPLSEWDLTYSWLSQEVAIEHYQEIYGLYVSQFGRFGAFLFTDPLDNSTTGSQIGIGDGATTTFQLGRYFGPGFEQLFDINGSPTIYLNGSPTSSFTMSSTGLITFGSAPGSGVLITASFSYYWRVRFNMDDQDFQNFVYQWWNCTVKLRQVRV